MTTTVIATGVRHLVPVEAGITKRQTTSANLQKLARIGVLTSEKRGRESIYNTRPSSKCSPHDPSMASTHRCVD